jgi:hypothetical protein
LIYCAHIGLKISKFLKLFVTLLAGVWEKAIDDAAQARTIALWVNKGVCAGENGFYSREHPLARDIAGICGRNFLGRSTLALGSSDFDQEGKFLKRVVLLD